jgi:exosome complex exonuclease DIS3/RRP44
MIPHFLATVPRNNHPRYADVCVHRLLAAAINVAPLPPHLSSKSYLHDLCANMNRRHRAAQLAGRASVQLHTLIFFASDAAGKEEDAYVLDVETTDKSEPSVSVMVPRYGIEGRVKLGIAVDDPKLFRLPDEHKIVYDNNTSVQVFDRIRVKIWVREVQDNQRELVIDLVSPTFSEPNKKQSKKRGRDQEKSHCRLTEKKSRDT